MGAARSGVGRRDDDSLASAPAGSEPAAALASGPAHESVTPSGRVVPREGSGEGANDGASERTDAATRSPREALAPDDRPSLGGLVGRYPLRPDVAPPPVAEPWVHGWLAIAAAVAALLAAALLRGPLRAALPFALALVAAVALLRHRRARKEAAATRALQRREREVMVRPAGLALSRRGAEETLIDLGTGFGATLFSSRRRDRVLLAITSRTSTLLLGATFDDAERRAHAGFLARASVVDGDEALDAIGPDGASLELRAPDFVALSAGLDALDAGASERILLSDGRGEPVVLDGPSLRVGEHRFDLLAPLDWRPFLFQEPFGGAVAVFQATWIRQGANTVVLVSLVPSILGDPAAPESTGIPELDRALLRDLRLTHAGAEDPPAREQRVAVDRLFVLPVRAALDRAPGGGSSGGSGSLDRTA